MTTPLSSIRISHQKVDVQADYGALIKGLNAEPAPTDPLPIGGKTISRADLIARFQQRIDAAGRTNAARAAYQKAVADERTIDAVVRPLRAETKLHLQSKLGKQNPKLQDFGFTPARSPKPTAEVKAGAQVKAMATRTALGTKGPQQKKKAKKALADARPTPPGAATPAATTPAVATPAAPATTNVTTHT